MKQSNNNGIERSETTIKCNLLFILLLIILFYLLLSLLVMLLKNK